MSPATHGCDVTHATMELVLFLSNACNVRTNDKRAKRKTGKTISKTM